MRGSLAVLALVVSVSVLECSPPAAPSKVAPSPPAPATATSAERVGSRAFDYPEVPRGSVVDDYHGVRVADPYRGLEDLDSPETRAFIDAENRLTFGFLNGIAERERIENRLKELWNYERYGVPERAGKNYFFTKNDGLQNQAVLNVAESPTAPARVLFDPNALSADGTVALSGTEPSDDGKLLAYGIASAGSDWETWHVRDVAKSTDLPDELQWLKFPSVSWTKDSRGFFYSRFPAPDEKTQREATNYFSKLYYHQLGTPQSADLLIYERPDQKEWMFEGTVTDDGRYLVLTISKSSDDKHMVSYAELPSGKLRVAPPFTPLISTFEAEYVFVGNRGGRFWFQTNSDASRGRIVAIDARHPDREHWRVVVPESPDTLAFTRWVGDRLIATYLKDAHSDVKVYDVHGRFEHPLELPGLGSVRGFSGRQTDAETFFSYGSFASPQIVYRYEPKTNRSSPFRTPRLAFDPADYDAKQVFVTSKDGTRVPVFLVARKDAPPGPLPTYLYGYGGFDISITPAFDVAALVWMEMGGLYAVATLRGGGEYGEAWHEAGKRLQKQNVFDDFIAVAQWLVANGHTTRDLLAIGGRSNGGLLVGACLTQRPDLFGAALPGVGVLDMLRYQKHTIGWAWADEYGTADDPGDFQALLAYSPLHNVKPGTRYPATLITTGDHDDRVVPSHSFKFAAALQAAQAGPAPILLRVETRTGHGAGMPVAKTIAEQADRWAFLVNALRFRPWSSAGVPPH